MQERNPTPLQYEKAKHPPHASPGSALSRDVLRRGVDSSDSPQSPGRRWWDHVLTSFFFVTTAFWIPFLMPHAASAEPLSCEAALNSKDANEIMSDFLNQPKAHRMEAYEAHAKALVADNTIRDLRDKIQNLRVKNGLWETPEITQKRLTGLAFESFLLLNHKSKMLQDFGATFSKTEISYVRYQIAKDLATSFRHQLDQISEKSPLARELRQNLKVQEQNQAEAEAIFLESANETMYLRFILDAMKKDGTVVEVTSLFGASHQTTDIHGNEIRESDLKEDSQDVILESMQMPEDSTIREQNRNLLNADIPKSELQQRAQSLDESFGAYFEQEPMQNLIRSAQTLLGPSYRFSRPTRSQMSSLRAELNSDSHSTDKTIQRLRTNLRNERMLRLALVFQGPQFIEMLNTTLGSLPPASRPWVQPLGRLLGLEYDAAVRRRHLGDVLRILSIRDPYQQLMAILETAGHSADAKGEFVVTYIRFFRTSPSWIQIKEVLRQLSQGEAVGAHQNQLPSSTLAAKIMKEFETYEDRAVKLGPLSIAGSTPDAMPLLAASGGSGMGYVLLKTQAVHWATSQWSELFSNENVQALQHWMHSAF